MPVTSSKPPLGLWSIAILKNGSKGAWHKLVVSIANSLNNGNLLNICLRSFFWSCLDVSLGNHCYPELPEEFITNKSRGAQLTLPFLKTSKEAVISLSGFLNPVVRR